MQNFMGLCLHLKVTGSHGLRQTTLPRESGLDQAFKETGGAREPTGGPRGTCAKRTSKTGAVWATLAVMGDLRTTGSGSVAVWAITQAGQSWSMSDGTGEDLLWMNAARSAPTTGLAPCISEPGMAQRTAAGPSVCVDAAAITPGIAACEMSASTARARARKRTEIPHMENSIIRFRHPGKSLARSARIRPRPARRQARISPHVTPSPSGPPPLGFASFKKQT